LIDGGFHFFMEKAVDEITVSVLGNPVIDRLFIDKGFVKTPVERPLIIRLNMEHKHKEKVKDSSNWYFTMGDSTEIF
jgi:hypothetical protein